MPEVCQRTPQDPRKATSNHHLPLQSHFLGIAAGGTLIKTRAATGEECCTFQSLETKKKNEVRLAAQRQLWMVEESRAAGEAV